MFALSTIPLAFVFRDQLFSILNQITGYGYSALEREGPTTLFVLLILVFIGGIIRRKPILKISKDNTLYFNPTYISSILATMAFIHPATLRVGYYYMLFLVLFIPEIIYSLSDKRIKAFAYIAVILALLFLYIRNLNPSSPFVPYEFFWK
ncbi:TPA: EpsG family protein [Streptococcus suis]